LIVRTQTIIRLAAMVIIAVALLVVPRFWGWPGLPLAVVFLFVAATFFLVRWHARHVGYCCPVCDYRFAVSAWNDFLSPHLGGEKLLRCPRCGQSSWCPEIDRAVVPKDQSAPPRLSRPGPQRSLSFQMAVVLLLYLGPWVYTALVWRRLPADVSGLVILKIPLITAVLPMLHFVFCFHAIRNGYRSRIYLLVTLFIAFFLALAFWMQYAQLARM
jgi:hypothetical protein